MTLKQISTSKKELENLNKILFELSNYFGMKPRLKPRLYCYRIVKQIFNRTNARRKEIEWPSVCWLYILFFLSSSIQIS